MPYGVITLDRLGTILRYNYTEAAFARRTTDGTIGLAFFTDVAPCTNVRAFKGRFDEFARARDSGVDRFDFTFAFRWGSQDVSITLLRKAEHEEINLIVRGRIENIHDVAPLAVAEPPIAPKLELGVREIDCATSWQLGSAEESAWRAMVHPDDQLSAHSMVRRAAARRKPYVVEYRLLGADRVQRIVQEHGIFASRDSPGFASVVDVTERRRLERELYRLALYDPLTGLPKRALLLERIAAAAIEARESGRSAVIFSLAVTRLQSLGGSVGRATQDELLRLVALRLGESIRAGDTVAHVSEEGFALLLTGVENLETVSASAARVLSGIRQPFAVAGRTYHLRAHLGISVTPRNGSDAASLLQAAETAMFVARADPRNDSAWFSNDMSSEVERDLGTEEMLGPALERAEFTLHYQPIVEIETTRTLAVEALVRWNHPQRGLVMPNDFVAVAERTGTIGALGEWILREACRQGREWLDLGLDRRVCVNVSAVQFRQAKFVDFVASVLVETSFPPHMLELELTESIMIDGFGDVIDTLTKLKLIGVRLA
ncbi:MAG: EAL domain-containing protein, partial [Candidatus Eremiobacteraeota bacterium]|nr:EAL domain-containing protein [Candidatus Eremiobacteraeota bacterium]